MLVASRHCRAAYSIVTKVFVFVVANGWDKLLFLGGSVRKGLSYLSHGHGGKLLEMPLSVTDDIFNRIRPGTRLRVFRNPPGLNCIRLLAHVSRAVFRLMLYPNGVVLTYCHRVDFVIHFGYIGEVSLLEFLFTVKL